MSILENWDEVKEAQEVAADSAGSTEKKYADYMDSIAAHVNSLKTTWDEFLMNLQVSGVANAFIDSLSKFISILDTLVNKTPAATIAITALSAALIRLTAIKFANMSSQIIEFANTLVSIKGAFSDMKGMGKLNNIVSVFSTFLSGKQLSNVATAAEGAGTALATISTGATTASAGITTLGGALSALAPYIAVIAGIGVALWAIPKIIDEIVVTNEELVEQIQTTQDNITTIEGVIDDYNNQLTTNKERIEEINKLKGTSEWNQNLSNEADSLERQNSLLEQKIKLEQQSLQLEKESLYKDQKELFDREFNKQQTTSNYQQQAMYDNEGNIEYYTTLSEGVDLGGIERIKQLVENQKTLIDTYTKNVEIGNKEQAESYEELANEQEAAFNDMAKSLLDYMESFDGVDDELYQQAKEMLDILYSAPTMSGQTLGEVLGISLDNATASAKTLTQQLKEISNVDIMPKDAKSMEDWLSQLTDTELSNLQWMLEVLGEDAGNLSWALNNMSGADAISLLNNIYKDYAGTVDDCTAALSAFNSALEKDFDEQTKGIIEMLDYFNKSGGLSGSSVINREAYNQSMIGLGFENMTPEGVEAATKAWNRYWDASTGQLYLDKFQSNIQAIAQENSNLVQISEDGTSYQIKDYGELATQLGLTEEMFMALVSSAGRYVDISGQTTSNALQESLKEVKAAAEEAAKAINNVSDLSYDSRTFNTATGKVTYNFTNDEETQSKVKEAFSKAQQEANEIAEKTGIKLNLHFDADIAEEGMTELDTYYSQVSNYLNNMQDLIDESGNFDFSKVTDTLSSMEGVTIDGKNIKFNSDEVASNVESQLSDIFEGMDISGIFSNMISSGFTFENVEGGSDAEAFGEELASQIKSGLTAEKISLTDVIDTNLGDLQLQFEDLTSSVTTVKDAAGDADVAIDTLNGKTLTEVTSSVNGLYNATNDTASQLSSISSWIDTINAKGNITVTVNYKETNKPTVNGAGQNGLDIPQYATGKSSNLGQPLRQTRRKKALVGEEAPELDIDANGNSKLVGVNGPEIIDVNAGDTIIPADVTKLILDGKINTYRDGTTSGTWSTGGKWSAVNIGTVTSKYNNSTITSSSSSNSSSSGSGSSSSSNNTKSTEDPAEDLISELKHRLNMEYITEKQYAEELTKIWETYYKGKKELRDKDWSLEEELHDLQKKFIEEEIDVLEYRNGLLERNAGTEQDQIANLQRMQELYHAQAEQYRANGFDDMSPEIRELSEAWWDAQDSIDELNHQMFENLIDETDHYIDILDSKLDRIPDFYDDFSNNFEELSDELNTRLDNYLSLQSQKVEHYKIQIAAIQTEINRLYQEGYEKNKEIIMDLQKQAEDVQNNIFDIVEAVRQAKLDNIEEQLNRQEEIRQGIIDYAEDQIKALEEELELLEKENKEKEEAIELEKLEEALENAKKNRIKRVYHADTGY